jgi:hypothetical protein
MKVKRGNFMFKAEFICKCGFSFQETFQEMEVIKAEDLEGLFVGCPQCVEEAQAHSFRPLEDKLAVLGVVMKRKAKKT